MRKDLEGIMAIFVSIIWILILTLYIIIRILRYRRFKMKDVMKLIKDCIKNRNGFAFFSCGETIIQGEYDHCVSSIAYSLAVLKDKQPDLFNAVMKEIDEVDEFRKNNNKPDFCDYKGVEE